MQHRIRAAALIVDSDNRLLLVKHDIPGRDVFWVPPGGAVDGEESLFDCARRETLEETGLTVALDHIVYISQVVEPGWYHCEIFLFARSFSGVLTTANAAGQEDEAVIKEALFLSREEMASLTVYPQMLKDAFWEDFKRGFPQTKYLASGIAT